MVYILVLLRELTASVNGGPAAAPDGKVDMAAGYVGDPEGEHSADEPELAAFQR